MTKSERARAARVMTTVMRVAGDNEGKGNRVMSKATRIAGEWTATAA